VPGRASGVKWWRWQRLGRQLARLGWQSIRTVGATVYLHVAPENTEDHEQRYDIWESPHGTTICLCKQEVGKPSWNAVQPSKFIFDKNYSVFIPARKDWTYDEVVLNDDVICYMDDGSRFEHIGMSGAGIYNHTDNKEVLLPLGHNTSDFQAEVYAVQKCKICCTGIIAL